MVQSVARCGEEAWSLVVAEAVVVIELSAWDSQAALLTISWQAILRQLRKYYY